MVLGMGKYINRGLLNPKSDESAKVQNARSPVSSTSKKIKFRRHCRRFWCFYLIANVIVLAIFLPVL